MPGSFLDGDDSFLDAEDGSFLDAQDPVGTSFLDAPDEPGKILKAPKVKSTTALSVAEDTGQFLKNVPRSVVKNVVEIGKGVGKSMIEGYWSAPRALYKEITKSGKWAGDFKAKDLGKEIVDTSAQVGDSLIEKYANEYLRRKDGGKSLRPNQMGGHGAWVPDPDRPGRFKKDESSVAGAVGRAAFHDPAGVALDVLAVKDLAAAGAKVGGRALSKAGNVKAAAVAEKAMLKTADATGRVRMGPKAIEAGLEATAQPNRLQRVGGAIEKGADLVQNGLSKSIGKGFEKVLQKFGHDPVKRKIVLQYKGEEASRGKHFAGKDEQALLPSVERLDPALGKWDRFRGKVGPELQAVRDVMLLGEDAPMGKQLADVTRLQDSVDKMVNFFKSNDPKALMVRRDPKLMKLYDDTIKSQTEKIASIQRVKKALDDVAAYYKTVREAGMKDLGVIDDARLMNRLAQQHSVVKHGNTLSENVAQSMKDIEAMTLKPMYVPTANEMKGLYSLDQMLNAKDGVFVPMLEAFSGKNPFATDPRSYLRRVINDYRNVESKFRWVKRIEQDSRLGRAVTKEEMKYIDPRDAMATKDILGKYQAESGVESAKALYKRELQTQRGDEAYKMLRKDPKTKDRLSQIAAIVPDKTVNRILKMEFSAVPGQFKRVLQAYDRMKRIFTVAATRLNPQYYTGNAVGDSILLALDGVMPKHLRMAEKFHAKGLTPYQATKQASVYAENFIGRGGKVMDWINDVDAASKRGVIVKHLADTFKRTGLSQMETQASVERALPSLNKLADLQIARGKALRGKNSREMKRIDQEIAKLEPDAQLIRDAVEKAHGYFGDYLGMGPIEQYVFTRFHPFYAFNKTMWKLAVKLHLVAPGKTRLWKAFADHMDDEHKKPSRYESYKKVGDSKWADLSGLSPFQGLRMTEVADTEVPSIVDPLNNPFLSAGFGARGGKTTYSPPYSGDVPAKGGKTYEYGDNEARKSVDQSGPLETIGKFVPVLPKIEGVLFPNGVMGGKKAFSPSEMMTPKGTPLNEKTRLQQFGAWFGLKLADKTVAQMSKEQKIELKAFMNAAEADIRRPQSREEMKRKIEEYKNWLKSKKIASD